MHVKIHPSYRIVVAVADSDLLGKKFEEGKRQLDVAERFYKDQEIGEEDLEGLFDKYNREDATFNIVGKHAVTTAIKAGIVSESDVGHVQGVPFILLF